MRKLVVIGALLGLSFLGGHASAGSWPSVRELELGLGLSPGAQLPKLVPAQGRGWAAYYVTAHAVGRGEYDVRVRLRPQQ